MKKLLLVLTTLCLSSVLFAGGYYQFANFVLNQDEEVVIVREMPTSKALDAIVKDFERKFCGDDGSIEVLSSDENEAVISGQFQSDGYYNPFAGVTQRILHFTLNLSVENGLATLTFSKMKVVENYVGFGAKQQNFNITNKIVDYRDNLAIATDKTQPKKARKDAEDILDDIESVLSGSDEEIGKRLDKFANIIK